MSVKLIRLIESNDLTMFKEYPNWGERTSLAYGNDPEFTRRESQSIREYWKKEGLQGKELERKVQTVMHNNALRRAGSSLGL